MSERPAYVGVGVCSRTRALGRKNICPDCLADNGPPLVRSPLFHVSRNIELDHLFMFVEPNGQELSRLMDAGLTVTYRREHVGQGTANACFCFDNLFLELLWVTSEEEVTSPAILRTRLHERSRWRSRPTCPFGFAWRESDASRRSGIACWMFEPPYLPAGKQIEVATDGDDPAQPMLFTFPGSTPPTSWPADRRGALQHTAGFAGPCSTRQPHVRISQRGRPRN